MAGVQEAKLMEKTEILFRQLIILASADFEWN